MPGTDRRACGRTRYINEEKDDLCLSGRMTGRRKGTPVARQVLQTGCKGDDNGRK